MNLPDIAAVCDRGRIVLLLTVFALMR